MPPFLTLPLRALVPALALAVVLGGCDFSEDDDPVIVDSDVVYVDFSLDRDDYVLSEDGLIASFESDDIDDDEERDAVEQALAGAIDGALVLLYVDGSLLFDNGEGTWSALPVTVAYEAVDSDGIPYVDYAVTYSYSYDDADLYVDALSSAELDFDAVLPAETDFRLVTAPASALRAFAHLDPRDYEAVRRAFALPD